MEPHQSRHACSTRRCMRGIACQHACRSCAQCHPTHRSSLRPDESPRRTGQCCEQHVIAEMSINPRRSLMLPPNTLGPWFVIVGFSGRCTCSQHEFALSRNFKTHSRECHGDGGNFAEPRGVRQTFQMEGQLNCHIRVSRIHHGQAICPTRPGSSEPCALCTAKPETKNQRQSSCVTIDRSFRIEHKLANSSESDGCSALTNKLPEPEHNGPTEAMQTGRPAPAESAPTEQHVRQWSAPDGRKRSPGGLTVPLQNLDPLLQTSVLPPCTRIPACVNNSCCKMA